VILLKIEIGKFIKILSADKSVRKGCTIFLIHWGLGYEQDYQLIINIVSLGGLVERM